MVKLIALYRPAADAAEFERYYRETHLPLAMRVPGLRKCEVAWVYQGLGGPARYRLVAELYFDDREALQRGLASPEGQAVSADVGKFAAEIIHVVLSDVETYPGQSR
jgi:uncharacterized protein (TIGR02118 family)